MSDLPTMLLSYDPADLVVAMELRRLLELCFRSLEVDLSGVDLDHELSFERVRARLRRAELVVALVSRRTLANLRVHFETGAGCATSHALVICMDGVRGYDLASPMNRLPTLSFDEPGIRRLVDEIGKVTSLSAPRALVGLDEMLVSVKSFLSLRNTEDDLAARPGPHLSDPHREPVDNALHSFYRKLKEHLRQALIKSLLRSERVGGVPGRDALKGMNQLELLEVARRANIGLPEQERLWLQCFEQDMPSEQSPRWKKMNACKLLEGVDEGLRRFERRL